MRGFLTHYWTDMNGAKAAVDHRKLHVEGRSHSSTRKPLELPPEQKKTMPFNSQSPLDAVVRLLPFRMGVLLHVSASRRPPAIRPWRSCVPPPHLILSGFQQDNNVLQILLCDRCRRSTAININAPP